MSTDLKKINKKNSRRNNNVQESKFVERLIKISRVSKVTKGGKKLKRETLRGTVKGTVDRPRLSVYRSNEHIYAQIIDDTNSKTLLACSTLDRSIKLNLSTGRTCDASRLMGEKLAELSLKKNVTKIVFDRGPYLYHGRIQALADGARAGGLQF